jgi:uncharacterized protein
MTEVFADAFYFIALLNPTDHFHAAAVAVTDALDRRLLTTAWVLTEVADALSAPGIRQVVCHFLQRIADDQNTRVVDADMDWYVRGLALYGNRPDKSWSLTDCISFEVMAQHHIAEALTGDHHFVQAGFQALLPPAHLGWDGV